MRYVHTDERCAVAEGDCLDVLAALPAETADAVVTDPPYELGFMGKHWDRSGIAYRPDTWAAMLRVMKPGAHLVAFGGTRTYHRMAVAIEDAGFEIRDTLAWLYGSGFPKSMDVAKAIDKSARGVPQGGADPTSPHHGKYRTTKTEGKRWDGDSGQGYGAGGSRFLADGPDAGSAMGPAESGDAAVVAEAALWQGWGTALKPAFEPIILARKPLAGTVAANVLAHGTGGLNIDGCRIPMSEADADFIRKTARPNTAGQEHVGQVMNRPSTPTVNVHPGGRWPANVLLDEEAAALLDAQTGTLTSGRAAPGGHKRSTPPGEGIYGGGKGLWTEAGDAGALYGDSGGASRFFYVAKAPKKERPVVDGEAHPTVKPLALMRWLTRMVTPPGGLVLDPFAGSGATLEAALLEGLRCLAIEREEPYTRMIVQRRARLAA